MNRKACFIWFLQAFPSSALEHDTEETIWIVRKTVLIGRRWLSTGEEKVQPRGKEGMERGEETRMRPDWEGGRRRQKEAEKGGRVGRGRRKRWGSDWEVRRKRLKEKKAWSGEEKEEEEEKKVKEKEQSEKFEGGDWRRGKRKEDEKEWGGRRGEGSGTDWGRLRRRRKEWGKEGGGKGIEEVGEEKHEKEWSEQWRPFVA